MEDIKIVLGKTTLRGFLTIPKNAKGIVLFAHGSGSSRHSSRNQYVANVLNESNLATLLMDLFTPEEEAIDEQTRELRFDIPFLAQRLISTTEWLKKQKLTEHLNVGYFGSSTGAAAALIAAAETRNDAKAVVSRGGRPDLAGNHLKKVLIPTLLIVGGADYGVIELNEAAFELLQGPKEVEIVPHATHLFEEPGTLEIVAHLARDWFLRYLE
jgi:dienelactone hydrolase